MFFEDIRTSRLLLKNIGKEDREFLLKEFSNKEVNRYLFDAEPMQSLKEAEELIEFYLEPEPRGQHRWIILNKETNEKMGTIGFHCWDTENSCVEIGYDLLPEYWAKGYMQEAMGAVLQEYLTKMQVVRVDAHIYEGNEKSIHLVEKYDFVYEGKDVIYDFHGEKYLHHIYSMPMITK